MEWMNGFCGRVNASDLIIRKLRLLKPYTYTIDEHDQMNVCELNKTHDTGELIRWTNGVIAYTQDHLQSQGLFESTAVTGLFMIGIFIISYIEHI